MSNQAFSKTANVVDTEAFKESLSNGDETAFKLLFEIYYTKIFNYTSKIVKSKEVSEELTLDLFMKLWNAKEMIKEVNYLEGFIYKMALNKALDFLRTATKEKRLRELLAAQMDIQIGEPADQAYLYKEFEQQLRLTIQQLPSQQQLVFNLCREQGFSHQEIAQQLNLSKNTVKNHMVNAIKRLRSILKIMMFFF